MQKANRSSDAIARSSPRLLYSSPDVRSSLRSAGITGEVVVFGGKSDPVLGHGIGKSGVTERYISSRGMVVYFDEGTEATLDVM